MARIGDSRLVYGTQDETWGYVQNLKVETSASKAVAANGQGNTVAVEMYNVGEQKVTGSFYFLAGEGSGPATEVGGVSGVQIQDASGTVHIDKAGKTRQVGNWCVIDFEGTHYPYLVNS